MRETQPIQTPVGGQYGDRKATEDAQRQIPLENTSGVQAKELAQAAAQQPVQQTVPTPQSVFPGELTSLDAPSARPGEPVTAGAASGSGANSVPLPGVNTRVSDALSTMARATGNTELQAMADRAMKLGQ